MKKGLLFLMLVAGFTTACNETVPEQMAGEYIGNLYTDNVFLNSLPTLTTVTANGRHKVNISLVLPGVSDTLFKSFNMVGVEVSEPTNKHYSLSKEQGNEQLLGSFYNGQLNYTLFRDTLKYTIISGAIVPPATTSAN